MLRAQRQGGRDRQAEHLLHVDRLVVRGGTDFPYRTAAEHVKGLADYGFSASDLRAIERDNAVRLMPRLKA